MKPDPSIAQALGSLPLPGLPDNFAATLEVAAYAQARAAKPSAWVDWAIAASAVILLLLAAALASALDPSLRQAWQSTWTQGLHGPAGLSQRAEGLPAAMLAALLCLLASWGVRRG